jgi:hypothetical protein
VSLNLEGVRLRHGQVDDRLTQIDNRKVVECSLDMLYLIEVRRLSTCGQGCGGNCGEKE